jgi:outer membrane receptor protein involved in Fe transport
MRFLLGFVALMTALFAPSAKVCAQFRARAELARPIAAGSVVDPTTSATTVELNERERALETTDEILLEVPGARRRRTGGVGGFTALSLRGAEAEHTTVLLGDVPLSTADGSAFDLSTVPPWLFDRIEVYRGGAPIWLGAGAIGGVLRLVPRTGRGRRLEAAFGGGTWGLAQGRASASVDDGTISWSSAFGLTHSAGDFPITIDTRPLEPGGLEERTQTNAHLLEATGLLSARLRALGGTFSWVALGFERVGGVPPPVTRWTSDSSVRRVHTRGVMAIAGEWLEGGRPPSQADLAAWRVQLTGSVGLDRRGWSDLHAQYGQVPRASDDLLFRTSLRVAGTLRLADWLDSTLVLSGWYEGFEPENTISITKLMGSHRHGAIIAVEGRLHGREGELRWELRPSARIELARSALSAIRPELDEHTTREDGMPTARLGGVVEFIPGFALQASVANATRTPSFIELFGDGGLLNGSTELKPEQSTSVDAGLVWRGRIGPVSGFAEGRGFALFMNDLIRYVRTDANQWTPQNVASAWVAGAEASLNATVAEMVSFIGSLTWLESRDETRGRALPFRPFFTGYLRSAVHFSGPAPFDRVGLWADVDYVSETYDTAENDVTIPDVARVGVGASLELWSRILRVDLSVRDLFDARGRDALLRPLPGRSVAIQLAIRTN